jgi:hypothetical protein
MIWKGFPTPPNEAGVESTLDIPYENITAAVVVFPKSSNQITCYENPMLDGLYLKVENQMIPNQPYNSTGARFLQEQLILNDLDGNPQATAEFTKSYMTSAFQVVVEVVDCPMFHTTIHSEETAPPRTRLEFRQQVAAS